MAIYFNDLTLDKMSPESNALFLKDFWVLKKRLWAALGEQGKLEGIVADEDGLSCMHAAARVARDQNLVQMFASAFRRAYVDEDVTERENWGLEADAIVELNGRGVSARMMGWAEHVGSLTLGLSSSKIWKASPNHDMTVLEADEQGEIVERFTVGICVTEESHLKDQNVLDQIHEMRALSARGYWARGVSSNGGLPSKGRIIVIGSNDTAALKALARDIGFDVSRFEFIEYSDVPHVDCGVWRNSRSIAAIMCGASPHNGGGMGDVSSFLRALEQPGFPPLISLRGSSRMLKVTKQSFRLGLDKLMRRGILETNVV